MKKLRNKKGFTIVEIIVTLAVLGIVIGPLMTMFITSQKINNEGSKEYKSIQLAQKYMEEIKGFNYINDLISNGYGYVASSKSYTKSATDGDYNIDIKVEPRLDSLDTGIDYAKLIVDNNNVNYISKNNNLNISILNNIDIIINDSYLVIEGITITDKLLSNKIDINLKSNATIDIKNRLSNKVTLNINNIEETGVYHECTVYVNEGNVDKTIFDAALIINSSNNINYFSKLVSKSINAPGDVDIEFNMDNIKLPKDQKVDDSEIRKLKVILQRDVKFKVWNNTDEKVSLFVYNLSGTNNYDCQVDVKIGEVQKINNNNDLSTKSNSKLYNITIRVMKNGFEINEVKGTKIFKY